MKYLCACLCVLWANVWLTVGDREREVLFRESLEGMVEANNYSHYSYNGEHQISIVLRSLEGDADLYVSQADARGRAVKPNFELTAHDLSSATCGDDRVDVPHSFQTPIAIAVFGHPSHDVSVYTLDVMAFGHNHSQHTESSELSEFMTDEELDFFQEFFGEPYGGLNYRPQRLNNDHSAQHNNDDNSSSSEVWDIVLNLLANILHILLEVIV